MQLRFTGGALPEPVARMLRFMLGVGGYGLLLLTPPVRGLAWLPGALAGPFVAISVVATLSTAGGRGLPGLAGRRTVVDARAAAPERTPSEKTPEER